MRILLADDDPVAQKMLATLLKRIGIQADAVCNGQEVMRLLQSRSYDVIFMDLQMPEMNGLETAIAIRDRWPLRRMRIIAITGCLNKGERDMCIRAGMDGYIAKPTKEEDILAYSGLYSMILHKKIL